MKFTERLATSKEVFCCVILLGLFTNPNYAAKDNAAAISKLAEKIVELRGEVETLNTSNNARKEELRGELKSLNAQKANLSAQIQNIELSVKQTQERLETIKSEISKSSNGSDELRPALLIEVDSLKRWVNSSLPFQRQKRLNEVLKIEKDLKAQVITSQQGLGRLWAFVEDELRLTRENGLHRQTLTIDGEDHLVSVAKLGMVAMFYRTADSSIGYAKKMNKDYKFVGISNKEQLERVTLLMEGLKKQIRQGAYTIPNVF